MLLTILNRFLFVIGLTMLVLFYEQMDVRLNLINIFRQLDKESRQFWVDLINCYMLNSKYVAVSSLGS